MRINMAIGRDWCFDKNRMNLCLPELDLREELRMFQGYAQLSIARVGDNKFSIWSTGLCGKSNSSSCGACLQVKSSRNYFKTLELS